MSDEHLSFDELAELAEGLLARRRTRAAEEHLATCTSCQERAEVLSNTTAALRALGPIAMPDDVAARLDRVIANAANASAGETVVPDLGAVRRRRLSPPSWSYAAAAAVVIIAGVSIVVATTGGHKSPAINAAGPRRAPLVATSAPQSLVQQESGQVYTPDSLSTLASGLVAGSYDSYGKPTGATAGTELVPAPATHGPNQTSKSATGSGGVASGSAPAPVASPPLPPEQAFAERAVPRALQRYANSRKALLACAAFISDTADAAPLAVDFARWSNPTTHSRRVPALIFVFADPQDSSQLDVYVVGASCNDSSLLDLQKIPRS